MNSLLRPQLLGPSLPARRASPELAPRRLGAAALGGGARRCRRRVALASAAPSWMEEAGVAVREEGGRRNPSLSDSYRPEELPRPNATVLEAQARVCTGPGQTRPLGEEQAMKVLDTILRSGMGELKDEPVSNAQLGAFFAGMTIRANSFPEATQWSEGERRAMTLFWPRLVQVLPPEVKFIADPEGTIMGANGLTGPRYVGQGTGEMRLVGALREVLAGGHLGYEEVQCVLKDILPVGSNEKLTAVSEALLAAFLIGQRMNRETDRELKAYCLAFDDELGNTNWNLRLIDKSTVSLTIATPLSGPAPVADVKSLTHYGEPYDGNTRFFRSTLFVAAVRACYGEACLLHGVEWMPPKDENTGFAYLNLQEACPPLYSIIGLREHIKKRPPLATSEKVQQFVRGEEGALSMTTKERSAHASKGLPVNHCSGFRTPSSTNFSETDGCSGAEDINAALERAREAVDSGKALSRLMSYIKISHKVS
ncbi:hypothetical protein PR202_ga06371 [Eleusine coracana subsp. coracana]|uniref:Uncharacterized protein n=1 Tax=Eleusine coracana subsp. coracana TaxID=191504 RepID=A0AAV5BVY0_ELECO|nr:hypothetical protein PR202_ga06371 [Eleusine coracana subsp. coracana]